MADIKSRRPYRLTDEKYDEWFTGFVTWYLALPDTPEYCNWLRAGLQALDDDYFAKRIVAQQADDVQMDASAAWRTSVSALRTLLIKLRISLLSLVPGDDSVLHLFRIDKEVPEDPDTLVDYATIADLAWQPHSAEPEYAYFAARLNNIAVFCDDVKAKRIAMRQAITAFSHASDEKTAAREACNERERAIFSFFRGEDLPDGFWTDSMWGLPSGGEEEPGGATAWDDKPIASMTIAPVPMHGILAGCKKYDGTKRFDLRIAWAKKNEPAPDMPENDWWTDVEQPVLMDADGFPLQKGYVYYLWIRARKDGEVSEWSEVAFILWPE